MEGTGIKNFFRERKNMKKIALVLSVMLFVMTAFSCGKTSDAGVDRDLLQQIREKGEIVIAMEGMWEPWTYHDETDRLVGFDTEIGEKIAEKLGVKATFVEGEWESLFAGLSSGRYDIIINGVEITEERAKKYDFTDPYAYIRTALIVRSDETEIKTFTDLSGKTTCNSIDSTYMLLAESYGAKVTGVDSLEETLSMVLAKRADATLNAEVSFYDYLRVHPDTELKVADLTSDASPVAIPVRKEENTKTFREELNKIIAELHSDGTLRALSEKYFESKDITEK